MVNSVVLARLLRATTKKKKKVVNFFRGRKVRLQRKSLATPMQDDVVVVVITITIVNDDIKSLS